MYIFICTYRTYVFTNNAFCLMRLSDRSREKTISFDSKIVTMKKQEYCYWPSSLKLRNSQEQCKTDRVW